ncbi:JmjC domain-containing protein [Kitasatospora mediocidica]|uniref:JmjC domain-containing protein n=1 Tax=Kitasatospora mediocidica TaxID=58352 RepID=UPI000691A6FB|nr:cupin domain-containing protein [Kitasatospora mediocidica]
MSALQRLVDDPRRFLTGWPDKPTVYERYVVQLAALFNQDDGRRVVTDPALRSIEVGMVHQGAPAAIAPDADHPTHTLVLNGLHLTWPPLAAFARQLAAELGHPITANVYRTPAASRGYGPHWDTHHVLLAQVEGVKTWRLHPPIFTDPLDSHRWTRVGFTDEQLARVERDAAAVVLEAGQVLFIPRGWIHYGHTDDAPSLHITFGVQLLTRHWILQQLTDQAAEHPELRAALPPNLSAQRVEELLADTTDALLSWLEGLDPARAGAPIHTSQQLAVLGVPR